MGNEASKDKGGPNSKKMTLAERRVWELTKKEEEKANKKTQKVDQTDKQSKSRSKQNDGGDALPEPSIAVVDSTPTDESLLPPTPKRTPAKKNPIKRSVKTLDLRHQPIAAEKAQFRWGTPVEVASVKGKTARTGTVITERAEANAKSFRIEFADGLVEEIAVHRLQIASVIFPDKAKQKELEKTHHLRVTSPARLDQIYNKIKMDNTTGLEQLMCGADPPIRVNEKLWGPYSFNPLSFNHDTVLHCAVRCRSPNVAQWALIQQVKQRLHPLASRIQNRSKLLPQDLWDARARADLVSRATLLQNLLKEQRACYGSLPKDASVTNTKLEAIVYHLSQPPAEQRGIGQLTLQLQKLHSNTMHACADPTTETKEEAANVVDAQAMRRLIALHQKVRFLHTDTLEQVKYWDSIFEGL